MILLFVDTLLNFESMAKIQADLSYPHQGALLNGKSQQVLEFESMQASRVATQSVATLTHFLQS
jgi:hypothetical protein